MINLKGFYLVFLYVAIPAQAEKQDTANHDQSCEGETCIVADKVQGSINNITFNTESGLADHVEYLHSLLKEKEAQIEEIRKSKLDDAVIKERLEAKETEIDYLKDRISYVSQSYEEYISSLEGRLASLERVQASNSDSILDEARVALADGNTLKAKELFQKLLDTERNRKAISSSAEARFQLGLIAEEEIDWTRALENYKRAYELNPDHYGYWAQAGRMHVYLGNPQRGLSLANKALAMAVDKYGKYDLYVAACMNNVGIALLQLDKFDQAIDSFESALDIYVRARGESSTDTATGRNNLGLIYLNIGEYDEALIYFQTALNDATIIQTSDTALIATIESNISLAYLYLNEPMLAKSYVESALERDLHVFGRRHPSIARDYTNLGKVYFHLKEFDLALRSFKNALDLYTEFLGEEHPYALLNKRNVEHVEQILQLPTSPYQSIRT